MDVLVTHTRDTLRWALPDAAFRLLPFSLAVALTWLLWRPRWLGLAPGAIGPQLTLGLAGFLVLFLGSISIRLTLARRRGRVVTPATAASAAGEGAYYLLNAPIEEAFFRGLVQGGLTQVGGPWLGLAVGVSAYVLYHRLGRWPWAEVAATALAGLPLALAFWLLPGAPSLLGVSIAHAGATCGFLGPGPYLLRRLGLLGSPVSTG